MGEETIDRFNIRVYGIIIDPNRGVLVAHETIGDFHFTKFPGGGLEFGEGLIDGLKRELMEELHLSFPHVEHFYTTDFFQPSAFRKKDQIISVYYRVEPVHELLERGNQWEHRELPGKKQVFEWIPLEELSVNTVTFPIDKHTVQLLLREFKEH